MHLKCGNKWHGSLQIPVNASIRTSPAGRDYYVAGITDELACIRFLDGNGTEYKQVNRKLVV
jgi:hypothetical protein